MAGEVKRSGFSNPANANLTASLAPPSPTVDFEIHSWGVQSTDAPNENSKIVFKWTPPATRALTITDAATDDVYGISSAIGITTGIYGANDTVISLSTAPTTALSPGDRITVGIDPTRYIVSSATGAVVTILYGLVYPQVSSGVAVLLLTKTAESPATGRQFRVNARTGDSVTIAGTFGFEYHIGWTTKAALGEWEDLNNYLVTISTATLNYYVKDSGAAVAAAVSSGARTVTVGADLTVLVTPGLTSVSFGPEPGTLYAVASITETTIILASSNGVSRTVEAGEAVWIQQLTSFASYDQIDIAQMTATKTFASTELGGWKLYYSESPIPDTLTGATLLETIGMNDARLVLATDGKYYFTWYASASTWDGTKFYFALTTQDNSVPANVSSADTNAWVITFPGQAVISSATTVGTTMTVTYENLTTSGTSNKHLREVMGGDLMTQYSIEGGYDIYLVDYIDLEDGAYQGVSTSTGQYLNTTLVVGDVVVVYDSGTGDQWTAHCVKDGEVTLNDASLTYSTIGSATPYSGDDCKHISDNITAKYARVTDRDTQSVLPLDGMGQKQYLTDYQATHVVTLTADTDQAVIMESVDTLCDSGKL